MLEIVELDVPDPQAGEVRVAISASGVNPTDWKARAGLTGRAPDDFQVPHHDGAGRVDAIGPGVTGLTVGQRVWLYLAAADNRYDTAAEFAVVPAHKVVPLPDNASDELGASLGVPALTAAYCLGGDPTAVQGRTVLVAGGAGAVGHFAIELAKHAGAQVITTVSSEEKGELARAAGADLVLNYREEDVAERILASVGHVDRVVEVALGANIDIDQGRPRAPQGGLAEHQDEEDGNQHSGYPGRIHHAHRAHGDQYHDKREAQSGGAQDQHDLLPGQLTVRVRSVARWRARIGQTNDGHGGAPSRDGGTRAVHACADSVGSQKMRSSTGSAAGCSTRPPYHAA
ncbi:NADPH:quinone reductase [Nocardia fusca]|uniref:NADPH:quinone reductase n=1 Tax=Nocardia fusca TaxID=941183 RepID=UPI0007A75A18|nr:NADPH:quinone reductase [Nocardia fusca]